LIRDATLEKEEIERKATEKEMAMRTKDT